MDQIKALLGRQIFAVNGFQITVFTAILVAILIWFLFYRKS